MNEEVLNKFIVWGVAAKYPEDIQVSNSTGSDYTILSMKDNMGVWCRVALRTNNKYAGKTVLGLLHSDVSISPLIIDPLSSYLRANYKFIEYEKTYIANGFVEWFDLGERPDMWYNEEEEENIDMEELV